MAEVNLRKVVKRYDDVEAVRGIDLDISDHEFIVLVGPSGCGKTTLISIIAGILTPTSGEVEICGSPITRMTDAAKSPFAAPMSASSFSNTICCRR